MRPVELLLVAMALRTIPATGSPITSPTTVRRLVPTPAGGGGIVSGT
jgi:hypothetical protein